jgi:hypothetical protein
MQVVDSEDVFISPAAVHANALPANGRVLAVNGRLWQSER